MITSGTRPRNGFRQSPLPNSARHAHNGTRRKCPIPTIHRLTIPCTDSPNALRAFSWIPTHNLYHLSQLFFLPSTLNRVIPYCTWSTAALFIVKMCSAAHFWTVYTIVLQFLCSLHFDPRQWAHNSHLVSAALVSLAWRKWMTVWISHLAELWILGPICTYWTDEKKYYVTSYVMVCKAMNESCDATSNTQALPHSCVSFLK
jgi:hypothetical protein